MTTQRLGNEGSFRPSKQIRACYFLLLQDQIFGARCSQFPPGSLEGVMFCASSSVWDKWKTFWLSLQGESASREELQAMLRRMQDASNGEKKREEGNTLIKQLLLIIMLFGFLFLFCVEEPACHFGWEWFNTATCHSACFCHYSMSLFMTFNNVTYLPVEINITVAYFALISFFIQLHLKVHWFY